LALLLAVAVTGWVMEATRPPRVVEVAVEKQQASATTVEKPQDPAVIVPKEVEIPVLVLTRDLATGSTFTKDNVGMLTSRKAIAKAALPNGYVTNPDDLVGKRLARPIRAEEAFTHADLSGKSPVVIVPGLDVISLELTAKDTAGGFVGPGSRVDVLGSIIVDDHPVAVTLLADVQVLAVNGIQELKGNGLFPDVATVSFAVTEKQALLLTLANACHCKFSLLLRHPDAPPRYRTIAEGQAKIDEVTQLLKRAKPRREPGPELAPTPHEKSAP
jgi:Flp pilus assembly protein CpaB